MCGMERPDPSEIATYYHRYIELVPPGDVLSHLRGQVEQTCALLAGLGADQAAHRYAPGKWSVRQVIGHLCDTERVMAYRALRFARGDATELPGFDENLFASNGGFDARAMTDLAAELRTVRAATVALFQRLDAAAGMRGGIANGNRMSVRSLAFVIAGHERHHVGILRERYGLQG
jgi:hypothetical protein